MTRIWWDSRPPYLKTVVSWWDWHTPNLARYLPGRCRECLGWRRTHRPDCKRRGPARERLAPWWMYAGLVIAMSVVDFCVVYILSSTGLPNTVSLWAWIGVCVVVIVAFNLLLVRGFVEWRREPK